MALLFDVSGSMDVGPKLERARDAAFFLLGGLESGVDEAAIYAFDSTLHVVQPFTNRLDELKGRLSSVTPWGATSLHDAIAAAAESMGSNGSRRRALVVLTDGIDTSSRMGPAEVARIASAIDIPVYVVAIVSPIDLQDAEGRRETREDAPRDGTLSDLARWTGGQLFSNTAPSQSSISGHRIVEELRHQVLDWVRTERSSGLASARIEGPQQRPHRAGPQWIRGRAIPSGQRLTSEQTASLPFEEAWMRKLVFVIPVVMLAAGLHGLRDEEVRPWRGRSGQRQGRRALDAARGDPGADAQERAEDRRSRHQGRCRR